MFSINRLLLLAAGLAVTAPSLAQVATQDEHEIELYLSEDAVQGRYVREIDVDVVGRAEVGAGVFFNEQRDLVAIATGLSRIGGTDRFPRFELRGGIRVYGAFLSLENEDVFGLGIGGDARYFLGPDRGSAIVLELFYAPDIAVFGTANNIKDASVRFEVGLRANTTVFVGYRTFEIDLLAGTRDLDDDIHIGFRSQF